MHYIVKTPKDYTPKTCGKCSEQDNIFCRAYGQKLVFDGRWGYSRLSKCIKDEADQKALFPARESVKQKVKCPDCGKRLTVKVDKGREEIIDGHAMSCNYAKIFYCPDCGAMLQAYTKEMEKKPILTRTIRIYLPAVEK